MAQGEIKHQKEDPTGMGDSVCSVLLIPQDICIGWELAPVRE